MESVRSESTTNEAGDGDGDGHLLFSILVVMVAIISGAVAALSGFGIGSLPPVI